MVNSNKIRELREAQGLTVSDFAEKVYVSQSFISHVEHGAKQPSVEVLKRMADYFGLPVDELLVKTA